MNPPLPASILIPALLVAVTIGIALAWRASRGLPLARRLPLLALRALALLLVAAVLLNFGRWVMPESSARPPWFLLLDRSRSMAEELDDSDRATRAAELAAEVARVAARHDTPLRLAPFDRSLGAEIETTDELGAPDGPASDLEQALRELTTQATGGDGLAGVVVLSDGRQTRLDPEQGIDALALRLRSREAPLHAVAIGAGRPSPDLALRAARPTLTAFRDQALRVPFVIDAQGLGAIRPEIRLLDESGTELARTRVELDGDQTTLGSFEVEAPERSTRWTLATEVLPGESRPGNNRSPVNLRLLESKTRVFLAEGAPYWDSKFLAQLLRQQTHMEVHSVHHLTGDRFFRIDSGDSEPLEVGSAIFPDDLDALRRYDLVVFGKNVDSFLTPARLEALRAYVRDHGGAVLFTRGKATTSEVPGLEALEPVTWARDSTSEFRFAPAPDGEAVGLFGEALPEADASVWSALPPLKDGRQVSFVKPFTRILAEGVPELSSGGGRFPVLLVRRYGQGVTGLVNADGLWKWDFFPEARELGNMYEDFWTQLMQWLASYSEFLPGQEFSLRLPAGRARVDESLPIALAYRGPEPRPQPQLRLHPPEGDARTLAASPLATEPPSWQAGFSPDLAGSWKVELIDPRPDAPPAPSAHLSVIGPPAENDDLRPDPEFLARLAEASGGALHTPETLLATLDEAFRPRPASSRQRGAEWQAAWANAPFALLVAGVLAAEWFLRRRLGLA